MIIDFTNSFFCLYKHLDLAFKSCFCTVIIALVFRYMNGAATNPDAHVVAYAAAQVKKGLEIAKKLGAENFG